MIWNSETGLVSGGDEATARELEIIGNLFSTALGTAQMRRDFGLPRDALVGDNVNVISARLSEAVGEALNRFAPRFEAKNITVRATGGGRVTFEAEIVAKR